MRAKNFASPNDQLPQVRQTSSHKEPRKPRVMIALIIGISAVLFVSGCGLLPARSNTGQPAVTEAAPQPTILVTIIEPSATQPVLTDPPVISLTNYQDEDFKLALDYPADWLLTVETAGDGNADSLKALRFQKGSWVLVIYYKYSSDPTGLGGGLPLGEVEDRGSVSLLGTAIPRHFVVHEGKVKLMFCGERFEDLEFYVELSANGGPNETYYDVDLPEFLFSEVDSIVSSIRRTAG